MTTQSEVLGRTVQFDKSGGQGHCWVEATDLSPSVGDEIAAEIIEGGKASCNDYLATNGCHYRWSE